eukprot:TRINITY_DN3691_c0_g1_i1.p1 TRINITY_DN3691_c0_g1~~TRINITY_DN3691_c0_g1_i1.p1  ORF type:complete len:166 (+),score=44.26 TRINITY_DN3691_c0_g1_i1:84-581(+)
MKEANYISPASFNKSKKRCRSFVPPKKMQLKDLCTLLNLAASTYSKPTHFQASLQGKAIPKYQAHSKPNQPNLFATCQETTPHHGLLSKYEEELLDNYSRMIRSRAKRKRARKKSACRVSLRVDKRGLGSFKYKRVVSVVPRRQERKYEESPLTVSRIKILARES